MAANALQIGGLGRMRRLIARRGTGLKRNQGDWIGLALDQAAVNGQDRNVVVFGKAHGQAPAIAHHRRDQIIAAAWSRGQNGILAAGAAVEENRRNPLAAGHGRRVEIEQVAGPAPGGSPLMPQKNPNPAFAIESQTGVLK